MSRPQNISDSDIQRWNEAIKNDPISSKLQMSPLLREVCYAGLFLREALEESGCSPELIARITYTAGEMSFGRDPWEITSMLLKLYHDQTLELEDDPEAEVN